MITIHRPDFSQRGEYARIQSLVDIDGNRNTIWFEVRREYGEYLCWERSDAFVIGLLNYAMRNGHDITCEAPMGEDLHYQITTYLIEAIAKGDARMYHTRITAEVDHSELPCDNAVGTGISCGIDSFHALAGNNDAKYPKHRITHLTFNNVGSHGEVEHARRLFAERKEHSRKFCEEFGFKFVESNSNIMDVIPQDHYQTHTFTSSFAIYCLQKLYSVYYYASGQPFAEFSLSDNYDRDCAYYDLLLAEAFSTRNLRIHSEGGALTRLEKTKRVITYAPSYNYLNVCTITAANCGKCEKCSRTLLSLEALGQLELYKNVFDIGCYQSHKRDYLIFLYGQRWLKNHTYIELYPFFKKQITPAIRIAAYIKFSKDFFVSCIRGTRLERMLRGLKKKITKCNA